MAKSFRIDFGDRQKEPVLTQLLGAVDALLLAFGCVLSCGAGFASDSLGQGHDRGIYLFIYSSFALPLTCVVAIVAGLFLTRSGHHRLAQVLLTLPMLDALLVFFSARLLR